MSLLPSDVVLIKFEQKYKNAKINTRQMSYMPNSLNLITLNNSHLKVPPAHDFVHLRLCIALVIELIIFESSNHQEMLRATHICLRKNSEGKKCIQSFIHITYIN